MSEIVEEEEKIILGNYTVKNLKKILKPSTSSLALYSLDMHTFQLPYFS